MENDEKRMISSYEVMQSIHIGKKEVVFGVDLKEDAWIPRKALISGDCRVSR